MSSKKSSKIAWTFEQAPSDELHTVFREHHYMGREHTFRFMRDHCYAAVHKGQNIAFLGTSSNSHSGQRLLWLVVLPSHDGYGIGLKMARLAASVVLESGTCNRVSFITEKKSLAALLAANGWLQDRPPCHPSPNKGESDARKAARLKVWQYRFFLTSAPEPAHIGTQVTSHHGIIFGDSCVKDGDVIEKVTNNGTEILKRGRPRKHTDDKVRWRLAQRAKRDRDKPRVTKK
jgi:hypothetical protein